MASGASRRLLRLSAHLSDGVLTQGFSSPLPAFLAPRPASRLPSGVSTSPAVFPLSSSEMKKPDGGSGDSASSLPPCRAFSSLPGPAAFWGEELQLQFSDELHASGCLSISLNRPKQLNALSCNMITALHALLPRAAEDPRVSLLVLSGQGDRAFCAGGDIRQIASASAADVDRLFGHEYALVFNFSKFKKPAVALWDGIVMGGGVGISIFASHRLCTESTLWAMPETAIGFFPDVAATFFLPRLKAAPGVGFFLGLVGKRLRAADLLATGLATHFVPRARLEALEEKLKTIEGFLSPEAARAEVDRLVGEVSEPLPSSSSLCTLTPEVLEGCRKYFSVLPNSYQALVASLAAGAAQGCSFAAEVRKTLLEKCPLSCAVWFALFQRAEARKQSGEGEGDAAPFYAQREEGDTLLDVLRQDFVLAEAFCYGYPENFKEGVRAVLVDKDNRPRWTPSSSADLQAEDVERMLTYGEANALDRFLH
uniref:3-hydroxyisobutyryl-CoA hydrolase n=1 Tax=Neospora caninum (strain Liverpool) TaxID=572307 RepID=A0A0F7UGX5_NEOCL|nr:TPA: 3-hydroxyisobutyryl-CoA hydrolase, mitochondrial precursor, putative [Neospora caninum Liverpool]